MAEQPQPPITESDLHFGHFAAMPEYRQVNLDFLSIVVNHLPENFRHLDLATGTGLVPQSMLELATKKGLTIGQIIGVDPNLDSLSIAQATTTPNSNIPIIYVHGYGQDLPGLIDGLIPEEGVDLATIFDAIHEIEGEDQKRQVLAAMAATLKPGGLLALNSAFTTESIRESPMSWGRWRRAAYLKLGGKRNRDAKPFKLHTPQEYMQMLTDTDLTIIHHQQRHVDLSLATLEAISKYPEFIRGSYTDINLPKGTSLASQSNALIESLDDLGIESLPRIWDEFIAQKIS